LLVDEYNVLQPHTLDGPISADVVLLIRFQPPEGRGDRRRLHGHDLPQIGLHPDRTVRWDVPSDPGDVLQTEGRVRLVLRSAPGNEPKDD
jgi:hypothetical protein